MEVEVSVTKHASGSQGVRCIASVNLRAWRSKHVVFPESIPSCLGRTGEGLSSVFGLGADAGWVT